MLRIFCYAQILTDMLSERINIFATTKTMCILITIPLKPQKTEAEHIKIDVIFFDFE